MEFEPTETSTPSIGPHLVSITGWWIEPSGRVACLDSIESHSFSRHTLWASEWLKARGLDTEDPVETCKALGGIRVSNLGSGGSGLFFDYDPCAATPQALMSGARLLAKTAGEFELWVIGDRGDPETRIVTDRQSTAAAFLVAAARAARQAEADKAEPQPEPGMRF